MKKTFVAALLAALMLAVMGVAMSVAAPDGTVIISPPSQAKTGVPGGIVTYTLTITNVVGGTATNNITDTIMISYTGNSWPVVQPVTRVLLAGGQSQSFYVRVSIPVAPIATRDTVYVTPYVPGSAWLPVQLTTTASFYRLYLPSIRALHESPQ